MSDYSALDRAFHRIVLGSPLIGEMLGDLDGALARDDMAAPRHPVYVTGLARAGTTVLMRAFHASGVFASLTYADMPMVMAPLMWSRLSARFAKSRTQKERAHGDGVMVDYDAPEALEEVFWRAHCGKDFIGRDGLRPHTPDADVLAAYRGYVTRVCHRHGKVRYLAKNNNLMLRLPAIREAFPDATVLVAVRNPIAQAESLLNQHRRFENSDAFTRSYMTWLVHHEFGADARPFLLPNHAVRDSARSGIDYWLSLWIACYGWLLEALRTDSAGLLVVVYERLCNEPSVWTGIAAACEIDPGHAAGFRASSPPVAPEGADPALVSKAREIYEELAAVAV